TYRVHIDSAIRGTNGAPLGRPYDYTFSTITQLPNSQIHADRIRITIPDANGVSTIIGTAGALPTAPPEAKAWRAVALRRGNAFITQYQVTSDAATGAFTMTIGDCGGTTPCSDAVSLKDHIDLQILNAADNIAAVLPLTPFVTADGLGFVAPPSDTTTFVSAEGVTITVPAGAFDQPTAVSLKRFTDDSPYAGIPSFHNDMSSF